MTFNDCDQALKYFTLDAPIDGLDNVLNSVKYVLASGHPVAFGFSVFESIKKAQENGKIPFPTKSDKVLGGHAIMAVGYDDKKKSLLIRNSWGAEWGEAGYGWLPYAYVETGLALDFWALIEAETGK